MRKNETKKFNQNNLFIKSSWNLKAEHLEKSIEECILPLGVSVDEMVYMKNTNYWQSSIVGFALLKLILAISL